MDELNRDQIDEMLDELINSSFRDDDNDIVTRNAIACCYSIRRLPRNVIAQHNCDKCHKEFSCREKEGQEQRLNHLVNNLKREGLVAKIVYHCNDCVEKYKVSSVEIWSKAIDDDKWNISIESRSNDNYVEQTDNREE